MLCVLTLISDVASCVYHAHVVVCVSQSLVGDISSSRIVVCIMDALLYVFFPRTWMYHHALVYVCVLEPKRCCIAIHRRLHHRRAVVHTSDALYVFLR